MKVKRLLAKGRYISKCLSAGHTLTKKSKMAFREEFELVGVPNQKTLYLWAGEELVEGGLAYEALKHLFPGPLNFDDETETITRQVIGRYLIVEVDHSEYQGFLVPKIVKTFPMSELNECKSEIKNINSIAQDGTADWSEVA